MIEEILVSVVGRGGAFTVWRISGTDGPSVIVRLAVRDARGVDVATPYPYPGTDDAYITACQLARG